MAGQQHSAPQAEKPEPGAPSQEVAASRVIYRERQWVPWYFWVLGFAVAGITAATVGLNRPTIWFTATLVVLAVIVAWSLIAWSSTTVKVTEEPDGSRWLEVKGAQLPNDVMARSLAVPKSAKRNALGPQLDPAAFVVTHGWIDEHVMLVLDDPEDPTPYWLVCTSHPRRLLERFVPEQAEAATRGIRPQN